MGKGERKQRGRPRHERLYEGGAAMRQGLVLKSGYAFLQSVMVAS